MPGRTGARVPVQQEHSRPFPAMPDMDSRPVHSKVFNDETIEHSFIIQQEAVHLKRQSAIAVLRCRASMALAAAGELPARRVHGSCGAGRADIGCAGTGFAAGTACFSSQAGMRSGDSGWLQKNPWA